MAHAKRIDPTIAVSCGVLLWAFTTVGDAGLPGQTRSSRENPPLTREDLDVHFRGELKKLADKCDELGMAEQAQITRGWLIRRSPDRRYVFFPDAVDPLQPPATASKLVRFWYQKFMEHRRRYAAGLVRLAKQSLAQNRLDVSVPLLYETLREDPQHLSVRRALGYQKVGGTWLREGKRVRSETARLRHPHFDFPPRKYCRVETAHYRITTNTGVGQGKIFGEQLEQLYEAWRQLFPEFWTTAEQLKTRLRAKPPTRRLTPKLRVTLFRNQADYVSNLVRLQPRIAETVGIYFDQRQEAMFFAGDERTAATVRHEATHQLFHERLRADAGVGDKANFWIIEGVALYLESLAMRDGYATVGGFDADRLQFARHRALMEDFYVPIEDLAPLGKDDLQGDANLPKLYSQAAGLTHFFMDGKATAGQTSLRQVLVRYLSTVYRRRDTPSTLADLSGEQFEGLNARYRRFLEVTDDDLAHLNPPRYVKNLALGRTSVTDRGLARLAGYSQLKWVNLAFTKTTDAGVRRLASATKLENLSLQSTRVTADILPVVGLFAQLEELDLSETNITNAGLRYLARLSALRYLWLTGTSTTDAGLSHLASLKNLESLHLEQTAVTSRGAADIKQKLPRIKNVALD